MQLINKVSLAGLHDKGLYSLAENLLIEQRTGDYVFISSTNE
jgi:hypothetical protein